MLTADLCLCSLQDIPVGTPVLVLVEDEEHIGAFADYQPAGSSAAAEPKSAPDSDSKPSPPAGANLAASSRKHEII